MHARTGEFTLQTDKIDEAIEAFIEEQLPKYQAKKGYRGFQMLANYETGRVIGISLWEEEQDLEAGDTIGKEAREAIKSKGGGEGNTDAETWIVRFADSQAEDQPDSGGEAAPPPVSHPEDQADDAESGEAKTGEPKSENAESDAGELAASDSDRSESDEKKSDSDKSGEGALAGE